MIFNFCANFIIDLRFTKACFTIDSEYVSARSLSSVCNSKSPIVLRGTSLNFLTKYLLIKVFYVGTEDPNLNMGRVLLRASNGGPFAALARIPDDYVHGLKHLPEAKKLVDDLMLFDNTAHGRGHRLVAHFHVGELMKLASSVPKWAQKAFGKEFEKWLGS